VARVVSVVAAISFAACGIDLVGASLGDSDPPVVAEAGAEASTSGGPDAEPAVVPVVDADVEAPIVPSNVDASLFVPDAGNVASIAKIDTSAGTIDGKSPPAGVSLSFENVGPFGVAVLAVGSLAVDRDLLVSGSRALVILASGAVTIERVIRVNAAAGTNGPGGYGPGAGPGAGGSGATGTVNDNSGGGGAGHGTVGGRGGDGGASVSGGDGGAAYELPLVGGSGGGRGDPASCTGLVGGAGGGALQIFSRSRIDVAESAGIHAGGGGGSGTATCPSGSGAGGGAGGYILLEAPTITIRGVVAANGGGGGGGDVYTGPGATQGADGQLLAARALGGSGSQSAGGAGGSVSGPPGSGGANTNAAGGGGAPGRIYFHFRGQGVDVDGGVVSPPAKADGGL
jgi:hypothetical protein